MKSITFLVLITDLFLLTCDNNHETEGDPSQQLSFQSLTAEKDTLFPGETTLVKAVAEGYKLDYYWSASAGDLLGWGAEVTYAASPCHIGTNQVSCEVKDGHDSTQTKTINIVVQ